MSFLKHLMPTWKINTDDKTKANAAILSVLDTELNDSESDAVSTDILMSLETAIDEWLDVYGKIFGVLRQDNETDANYRQRIVNYILLDRGTIPAIKKAIQNFLNDYTSYINIYEPFNNIFMLNSSYLNSNDCLLGEYYTTAVIDCQFTNVFPISIADTINKFKAAGVTVKMTKRPKRYNPTATAFGYTVIGDPVQAAINMQANRDSVYLSIENSGIIGYKRVYKMILARPLKSTETVDTAPYPVVYYANSPYCLIPTDQAVTEAASYVYVSAKLEDVDFPNTGYANVKLFQGLIPVGDKKNTLLPSEVTSTGTQLLVDNRTEVQQRSSNLTIEEEFMISLHN